MPKDQLKKILLEFTKKKKINQVNQEFLTEMKNKLCLTDIKQQLRTANQLGIGAFSKTYKVTNKYNEYFAVKVIDKNSKGFENLARNEIKLHKSINHPNIVKFIDFFESGSKIYIVLEYVENSDLFRYMQKNQLSEIQLLKIFYQTCLAINHIHIKNILHRDLKPENILLDKNLNAKICDFGWSSNYNQQVTRQTVCGTYEYMAPEILLGKQQSKQTDVWSLGILLYELFHQRAPFQGSNLIDVKSKMFKKKIQFKKNLNLKVKNLIQKILILNQHSRLKIRQILSNSLFKMFQDQKQRSIKQKSLSQPRSNNSLKIQKQNSCMSNIDNNSIKKLKLKKYCLIDKKKFIKQNINKQFQSENIFNVKFQTPVKRKIKFLPCKNKILNSAKFQTKKNNQKSSMQQKKFTVFKKQLPIYKLMMAQNIEQSKMIFQNKEFSLNKFKQKKIKSKKQQDRTKKKFNTNNQKENKKQLQIFDYLIQL